jgi:cob(I)alamin adenosyltransferase
VYPQRQEEYDKNVAERVFNEPRIALNRIYTRRGDTGQTALVGGQRVDKDSLRIECYGTVDELNSLVGLACVSIEDLAPRVEELRTLFAILRRVQHEIEQLESDIDRLNEPLAPLRSFVLPGGSRLNAELHLCRTVCRRAERIAVALSKSESVPEETIGYLNRLSDAFFVWSRWANHKLGAPEVLWQPNQAASAQG